MTIDASNIRPRILLPLGITIAVFIIGFVATFYQSLESEIRDSVTLQAHRTHAVFEANLTRETAFLEAQLEFLQQDTDLQQAFLSRNRPALLGASLPIFQRLRENYRVTHLYFSDPDRVNFLRVHNPASFGDEINRYTTREAERTGTVAAGLELGVSGLFTLRVVLPWEVSGERIGYLELGMEVDHVVALTQASMQTDLALLIEKSFVDRTQWENGMQSIGRQANWDQFRDFVIVDATIQQLPLAVDDTLLAAVAADTLSEFEANIDEQHFQGRTVPLPGADGRRVGSILMLADVTQNYDLREATITRIIILMLLVGITLFAFFFVYVGRIQSRQSALMQGVQDAQQEIEQQIAQKEAQFQQLERVNREIETRIARETRQREILLDLATQIEGTVNSLNEAATDIVATTTEQVASASEQEAAVTETATTVEQVQVTVRQTAERAGAVSSAAQQAMLVSQRGEQAVLDSIRSMQAIEERVQNIATTILALSERTQQIGEIIESVNALAGQSKLLALNASIEAARAGEEGKGFAVVASEVRQLAEQSRQATARVADILREIQQATNTAVMVTEEGSKGVQSGVIMANTAGEAIRELAGTLENTTQTMIQIADSTQQQIISMEMLVKAIRQIREASNQTVSSSRQTEQTARNLSQLSQQLEATLANYELKSNRG